VKTIEATARSTGSPDTPDPAGGTLVRRHSTYEQAGPCTTLLLRFAVRDSCKRLAKAASGSSST